jgi:DNA-binding transcriptional LysR family regulator
MNHSDASMQPLHLSRIDVNLLVGLDTLLRERSVTTAAKRLGLSQSAMSHQLRRLRELFDDPILVGGRGGMVTTPLADTLEGPIRRALLDLGRAIRGELSFDPATAERTFTVATTDSVELLGLPPLLELLTREAPGIGVHGRPLGPSTFTALQEGDVDLVIGPDVELALGVPFPGLRCRVLAREPSVCVVRTDHPIVARARREGALSLERFLALRHVQVLPPGPQPASSVD